MQPRVTVALATVWLTVAGLVGGAVILRLSHDQYSPATPRHHAGVQRDQTGDWRDHEPAEDQPLDLWIGSRRSISAEESSVRDGKFIERDFPFEMSLKNIASSSKRAYPLSDWQKWSPNITGAEFAADKVDYGYEMPETLSREIVVPPSDLLDDPFVADDTFQDQGPGSVEIYKLDLSKEKALLTATTPSTNSPSGNKSKAPKKTGHLSTKTKTTEIKSTTMSPEIHHRQSNFFEEQRTETPSVNRDSFGVGGVPELQVGCEGLEALSSHKAKRSIDTPGNENGQVTTVAPLHVTPVSLDLDYDVSYEESYEEMDELFKLKKLETTTKGNKPNRGDMDASYLNSDHLDESKRPDKLPIRGDLGESAPKNASKPEIGPRNEPQKPPDSEIKKHEEIKAKRESLSPKDDDGTSSENRGRRLLWLAEANTEALADGKSEQKRARRSIDWGYGENEGVVSSDELQTLSQRRRQHDIRYHQDVSGRRDQHQNGVNPEIDNIRREHEKLLLEQRRREDEERQRQMQQGGRGGWEDERRRDEMQRRQHEDYDGRTNRVSTSRADDEDTQQRQVEEQTEEQQTQKPGRDRTLKVARRNEEEQRRRHEEELRRRQHNRWQESTRRTPESVTLASDEERRRLYDEQIRRQQEEERQRRLREEEARRQEQYRWQEELRRRKDEEERRRQEDSSRNLSENDRRRLEEHRRETERRRQEEEEDERRRQQAPSSLRRPGSPRISNPNDIRERDRDEERRAQEQEERRREQKLREYIARNRPINVSRAEGRSEEERRRNRPEESRDPRVSANRNDEEYRRRAEEQRRRQDEERRLQDYIRRNQPVNVPSRSNQSTATDRNPLEERRLIEEARRRDRYPDPGARRQHGPSASTYIDPRSSPEEVRRRQQETARRLEEERRQRYEAEERRKELARRQQEKEEEGRQREERMRKEAARREEETRREQSRRYEEARKRQEEARKRQEEARLVALQRRQERRREEARGLSTKGTRQPEATRSTYYENRLLAEHRRRQDSRPIPNNLVRNQNDRRIAAERERQRQEAARRRQEERTREDGQKGTDHWRRHEVSRLNSLPVSATIIVRPGGTSRPVSPAVIGSRSGTTGLDNEIDFTGINPHREGVKVPQFPVPPTRRPPVQGPGPCIWAVVQCCSINRDRLVKCFESMGCPGVNWDPNPCRSSVANAARLEVMRFYENQ